MFTTSVVSTTADEFDICKLGSFDYKCLWAEQGVGIFAHQENGIYSVMLVVLNNSRRSYRGSADVTVLTTYKARRWNLESIASAMKQLGKTVVVLRSNQWTIKGSHSGSIGVHINAEHRSSNRKISKYTVPTMSVWGTLAVKKIDLIFRRHLKESTAKLALERGDRLDKLQEKLSEEKLSFMHLALRMLPEADSQTLELIALQAQSLATAKNLDMVAAVTAASQQISQYPALKAGH